MSRDELDDLDVFIEEELANPEFEAAFEDARSRSSLLRRMVTRRKARRISQATVAERMETTQSAVSELESGSTDPRLSTMQRYARAIGCRLDVRLRDDGGDWRFSNAYAVGAVHREGNRANAAWVTEEANATFSGSNVWSSSVYALRREGVNR
ncbi:helix-turn-helix domain-containing protein [Streptomyces sp. NPDC059906]|uniref:helix-turn-helix domain-containing protein n=1 Tax=Streptomyces sp. NPDC059906 TaxID=3346997 RepID=UPI00366867B7